MTVFNFHDNEEYYGRRNNRITLHSDFNVGKEFENSDSDQGKIFYKRKIKILRETVKKIKREMAEEPITPTVLNSLCASAKNKDRLNIKTYEEEILKLK